MGKIFSFEKSVGGVIFRMQEGKILYLLLRYRSWQWDFPKGHTEKGETEEQTLRREIEEETGIEDIKFEDGFRKSVYYFYKAKGNEKKERVKENRGINIFKKVVYYCVETEEEDVVLDFENKDFAWLTFEQAFERIGNKDSEKILRAANELLIGHKI